MPGYILSNNNRYYVAAESVYGSVAAITSDNRVFGAALAINESIESHCPKPKTGTRTFGGWPAGFRRQTSFDFRTYLYGWADQSHEPAYGPLFRAALGGPVLSYQGGAVEAMLNPTTVRLTAPHGLASGQAITAEGEIRFVTSSPDPTTVTVNAPFTVPLAPGSPVGVTVSYAPGGAMSSVSLFDYWTPASAVQRLLAGAAVDEMRLSVNGCYHQFRFSGPGRELIDNLTFEGGQGGLASYPAEPEINQIETPAVAGNLGQAWFGATPAQFFTVTAAEIVVRNHLELRNREFGSNSPRAVVPGEREVTATFDLYEEDADASRELYQAARQRSPICVFLQMGQAPGQLFGVNLRGAVPEVPSFDDRELRLQWRFSNSRAQGFRDDEVMMAFG